MKTNKKWLSVLVFGLVTLSANFAQAGRGEGQLLASCSAMDDDRGNYVGGISIYQDSNDRKGVLRGNITDNYMSGYLTCHAERDNVTFICGGIWDTFGRGTEALQARLVKTATPGVYSFDLARRPTFYGGAVLRNLKCTVAVSDQNP